ncbi:MAG: methylenetetrahydrofolate reductase [NAD(P)H] [Planctomycetota bacterium]
MHIADVLTSRDTTISFEFFPPKTRESADRLFDNISKLEELRPAWVSVTYGAGGGTRDLTHEIVRKIIKETTLDAMPHLTCIGHTEAEIYDILEGYVACGVSNILALGGDPPRDQPDYDRSRDAFRYASQLVEYIVQFRERHAGGAIKDPRGFGIAVAGFPEGHPGTPDRLREIDYLKAKVDAGADCIVTQLFFQNSDFHDFRERCRLAKIDVPIIAGVMPVTSAKGVRRMSELAAGARFPAPLLRAIERAVRSFDDPDSVEAKEAVQRVGVHWATEQCRELLDSGADGIHLYTLNQSSATREIYANLGVRDSLSVA